MLRLELLLSAIDLLHLLNLTLEVFVLHLQFSQLILEILGLHLDSMFFVFQLAFELTRYLVLNEFDFVLLLNFHSLELIMVMIKGLGIFMGVV